MPERDVLLATKLHVPRARGSTSYRARGWRTGSTRDCDGGWCWCTPAGCRQTVLLADWARRGQRPVGWLSLDGGDDDQARFWRHAVAALDQAGPGIEASGWALCSARRHSRRSSR